MILNTKVYSETTQKLKIDQHEPPHTLYVLQMGRQFLILFFANLAIETTSSGISINGEIYTPYACLQEVAIYKWKVQSEADLATTVASFISNSMATTF